MTAAVLGLRANARQFGLLVVVNAFVGAMVGIERSVLPVLAEEEFGIASATAVLSFVAVFGLTKAAANLAAGTLADRFGRRRLLILGWLVALPVAPMIIWAPSWGWVVAANAFLGVNQGLAWSMTVVMKIDLAGPERRGLAMGLNEASGYVAVAVLAWATAALASAHGPETAPFVLGLAIAVAGLALSVAFVRDTADHVHAEVGPATTRARPPREVFRAATTGDPTLSAASQAGLVTNLNDGLAWGLVPIFLAGEGLTIGRIGVVAALYPAVWGLGQLLTGAWSDHIGRKPLIVAGMSTQAAGIALLVAWQAYPGWLAAAVLMGAGTALTYPTLIAVVADRAGPVDRAAAVGVYRWWRDLGFVAGALVAGAVADVVGMEAAILMVAAVTGASGVVVAVRMSESVSVPAWGT